MKRTRVIGILYFLNVRRAIISVLYLAYAYGSPETEQQQQQTSGGIWSWMTSAGTVDEHRSRRQSVIMQEEDLPDSDETVKKRRLSQVGR